MMKRYGMVVLLAAGLALAAPGSAHAQDAQQLLPVGSEAPDVVVTGATRYGVIADPVRLSDFRGDAVVLAFFFRARTPG